jgi:hypothetical protein
MAGGPLSKTDYYIHIKCHVSTHDTVRSEGWFVSRVPNDGLHFVAVLLSISLCLVDWHQRSGPGSDPQDGGDGGILNLDKV